MSVISGRFCATGDILFRPQCSLDMFPNARRLRREPSFGAQSGPRAVAGRRRLPRCQTVACPLKSGPLRPPDSEACQVRQHLAVDRRADLVLSRSRCLCLYFGQMIATHRDHLAPRFRALAVRPRPRRDEFHSSRLGITASSWRAAESRGGGSGHRCVRSTRAARW